MPIRSEVTDYFCIAVGFCKVFWRRVGRVCRLERIMEDVSFLCILFIFAFSPFPIRQYCDLPYFWRMGFFSWLRQCVTLSHPIELRNSLIFYIRNLMGQKSDEVRKHFKCNTHAPIHTTFPLCPYLSANVERATNAHGSRHECTREQTQPHLGAETNASGSRRSCIWEQTRLNLGRCSPTDLGGGLTKLFYNTIMLKENRPKGNVSKLNRAFWTQFSECPFY